MYILLIPHVLAGRQKSEFQKLTKARCPYKIETTKTIFVKEGQTHEFPDHGSIF